MSNRKYKSKLRKAVNWNVIVVDNHWYGIKSSPRGNYKQLRTTYFSVTDTGENMLTIGNQKLFGNVVQEKRIFFRDINLMHRAK